MNAKSPRKSTRNIAREIDKPIANLTKSHVELIQRGSDDLKRKWPSYIPAQNSA